MSTVRLNSLLLTPSFDHCVCPGRGCFCRAPARGTPRKPTDSRTRLTRVWPIVAVQWVKAGLSARDEEKRLGRHPVRYRQKPRPLAMAPGRRHCSALPLPSDPPTVASRSPHKRDCDISPAGKELRQRQKIYRAPRPFVD